MLQEQSDRPSALIRHGVDRVRDPGTLGLEILGQDLSARSHDPVYSRDFLLGHHRLGR
jgi:hypothetical protein